MKISVLQPEIIRGDMSHNGEVVQTLIEKCQGDLMVLPEYALTGSLVLDANANVQEWVQKCRVTKEFLLIPEGKRLLINTLLELDEKVYNCCELLPDGDKQCKLFPDQPELDVGITGGEVQQEFAMDHKRFKVIICTDLRHINKIDTSNVDFILFIFHFCDDNYDKTMSDVKDISIDRGIPIIISSIVSDQNIGYSSYVNGETRVSIGNEAGVLEIEL